jgi:hypothetical protein
MYVSHTPIQKHHDPGPGGVYNYLFLSREEAFAEAFDYGAFANPIKFIDLMPVSDEETITANLVVTYAKTFWRSCIKIMAWN